MINSTAKKILAIKVDVDTDRGTRIGIPNLLQLFSELNITATFLFSLGPDNTGRAIKRIFRPGFLKKVGRSGVVSMYGIRTLLNGTLLPGPHIAKRNKQTMDTVHQAGHEVGIHCYDHIRWQDDLEKMSKEEVCAEFAKARQEFENIFHFPAQTAGAAGWQANALSLAAYDDANLLYASDARGTHPFFPQIGTHIFKTLQIPTTLPTLDELLGRPEYPLEQLTEFYLAVIVKSEATKQSPSVIARSEATKQSPSVIARSEATKQSPSVIARSEATKQSPSVIARSEATKQSPSVIARSEATKQSINVFTIHAEIEGMKYLAWFKDFLQQAKLQNIEFVTMENIARHYLHNRDQVPVCELIQAEVDGRSGKLAVQNFVQGYL